MILKSQAQVDKEREAQHASGTRVSPSPVGEDVLRQIEESGAVLLTAEQVEQLGASLVTRSMVNMGYKPGQLHSGRIYRQDMLDVISIRQFEKARITGRLRCHKDGSRNSKVWARREDWEKYLREHTNRKS